MDTFVLWLVLDESGRLDIGAFNGLFRDQLDELIRTSRDPDRKAALLALRRTHWMEFILASLRNAGIDDEEESERAAAEIAERLLVMPGQLFRGFDPARTGSLSARFATAVRNAIANRSM